MTEADAIAAADRPATRTSLATDLTALGVESGMTLMVHSSLSRLGFVAGGAPAVVLALLDAVGPDGTVMMPTLSNHLGDPAEWRNPPVPETWWQTIRDEVPAYDPALTPTRLMGAIVECFRHQPGVRRSAHPTASMAATGPRAPELLEPHELDYPLGEASPLARLYALDAHILLLGVTHANNTSLHLAEYRSPPPTGLPHVRRGAPILHDGERVWATYDDIEDDDEDFADLGEAFAETGLERCGPVGAGVGRLMRSRDVVDFGVEWLRDHRHGA
ncbi:MAG: AAC(3) family N-acetyltransferase [Actinomycetota bacterium]